MPTMGAWLQLDAVARLDFLHELLAPLRRELRVFASEPEPRRFRVAGPRVQHRRSGVRFCFVPGDGARAAFFLAEDSLTRHDAQACGVDLDAHHRFAPWDESDDTRPIYLHPEEIAGVPSPLRLPSDSEWEAACRAGSRASWFWGEVEPTAPPAIEHPLGLTRLGWYDELTSDGRVRGGAARLWPWKDDGAGPELLRAEVSRPWDGTSPVAIRVAMSLPT